MILNSSPPREAIRISTISAGMSPADSNSSAKHPIPTVTIVIGFHFGKWVSHFGTALMMILARFAAGVGVGAASVLSPAYISEVTPASMRGRLSSLQQVMIIAGLTGAFLANYFLAYKAGKSTDILWLGYPAWRWMFWMQIIPASVFFVTLLLIPESPRYLVARGRDEEARSVLTRLFGAATALAKAAKLKSSIESGDFFFGEARFQFV